MKNANLHAITMVNITASIVLYNNSEKQVLDVLKSFTHTQSKLKLYLIDNSPTDKLNGIVKDDFVEYVHNPSNPGFGAAHNIAINLGLKEGAKFHFIINPDIYFNIDVITPMVNYMVLNKDIGGMMPKVLYMDGSIQYLPKLLPSPFWIFKRKFKFLSTSYQKFIDKYELRNIPTKKIYNSPILSGCFTLLNLDVINEVGFYDDRYFMYFEDFDLSRRIHEKYKTIYYPQVSVYHGYEGGANNNIKLLKIFILSAIAYFNKWGWFFDNKRQEINIRALDQLNNE